MLKFKVVLVKRNKGYLAYLYDTKDVLETKTWSKKKILRLAQESILKEVKKRGDIFNSRFKESPEQILTGGYIAKSGDKVEVETVGIEFSYNGYYRLGTIED